MTQMIYDADVKKFMLFESNESVGQEFLRLAQLVKNWSQSQTSVVLRGSSLLLAYDADNPQTQPALKMIDFAHAFHGLGKVDNNYLTGITNFVSVLETGELPPTE